MITRTCSECHEDWLSEGEYECPYCGFDNPQPAPLTPEGPSMVTICGWHDGAREMHDAAVAMGREVTTGICTACAERFMAEGQY